MVANSSGPLRCFALALGIVAPAMIVPVPAMATSGSGSSAQGVATATVVAPLSAVATADLDFGIVASGQGAGGVVVSPSEAGAVYEGAAGSGCMAAEPCPLAHPASFAVTGERGRSYIVTVPQSLALAAAAGTVVVDGFAVWTASRPGAGPYGTLDAQGADRFAVGATLRLVPDLPAARYRAAVPVVVAYF